MFPARIRDKLPFRTTEDAMKWHLLNLETLNMTNARRCKIEDI